MKVMKKKMIGLLICMLFVATIPMAAGMLETTETQETEDTTETTALRKTFMWGFISSSVVTGRTISFRAFWVHYNTFGKQKGVIKFPTKVILENNGMFMLRGNFIFGIFDGEPVIR